MKEYKDVLVCQPALESDNDHTNYSYGRIIEKLAKGVYIVNLNNRYDATVVKAFGKYYEIEGDFISREYIRNVLIAHTDVMTILVFDDGYVAKRLVI